MMKMLCFCLAMLTVGALAQDSPWNGTWRLNRAKSQMTGATLSYTRNANGSLHYSNGGAVEYNFACDGKEYPTMPGRTITCTKTSETIFETVTKVGGEMKTVSHRVLSDDGRTMAMETMGIQPDGSTFTDRNTYRRVSGTSGLAGKWKSVKGTSTSSEIEVIKVSAGVMHMEFPGYQDRVDAKLDGTDSPLTGATLPPGLMVSVKVEGPRKMHLSQKLNGKVLGESEQTLSEDGKTLTETAWVTGKVGETQTFVYERQAEGMGRE